MRISDWSSDVCSSDLTLGLPEHGFDAPFDRLIVPDVRHDSDFVTLAIDEGARDLVALVQNPALTIAQALAKSFALICGAIWLFVHMFSPFVPGSIRSEEHTSELQSLMRISYAVFCLKKKT